jgi:hypothetical protein
VELGVSGSTIIYGKFLDWDPQPFNFQPQEPNTILPLNIIEGYYPIGRITYCYLSGGEHGCDISLHRHLPNQYGIVGDSPLYAQLRINEGAFQPKKPFVISVAEVQAMITEANKLLLDRSRSPDTIPNPGRTNDATDTPTPAPRSIPAATPDTILDTARPAAVIGMRSVPAGLAVFTDTKAPLGKTTIIYINFLDLTDALRHDRGDFPEWGIIEGSYPIGITTYCYLACYRLTADNGISRVELLSHLVNQYGVGQTRNEPIMLCLNQGPFHPKTPFVVNPNELPGLTINANEMIERLLKP